MIELISLLVVFLALPIIGYVIEHGRPKVKVDLDDESGDGNKDPQNVADKKFAGVEEQSKYGYKYKARQHLMTAAEERCFKIFNEIFERKFYVVPQVHLSALLDHTAYRQNWKGAFSHINGKSVDFVLLNRETLKPICAVELDDYTHGWVDRAERDREVEVIFKHARLPLVRIKNPEHKSRQQIIDEFTKVINT